MRCAACNFKNPSGMRFCGQCGNRLIRLEAEAERRQLTVMFCDLVGSTALSQRLDPEELRQVVRAYQQAAVAVIHRFEGYTAQYLGDGILVYFGYPRGHEDAPTRAVHAGLGIIQAIATLNDRLRGEEVELALRVGVHTGLVVAGEVGAGASRELLALGETPNIAARIEAIAPPNSLVLSQTTYDLVKDSFVCDALGPQMLKGLDRPITAFRAIREKHSSSDQTSTEGVMVGRERELGQLFECFDEVKKSQGRTVIITGGAGIGKSRLLREFLDRLTDQHSVHASRCFSYEQASALSPVISMVRGMFGLEQLTDPELMLQKLIPTLEGLGLADPASVRLLAEFLSISVDDRFPALDVSSSKQKELTYNVLLNLLIRQSQTHPLIIRIEGLHWADPSTIEFLSLLSGEISQHRVLLTMTSRPDQKSLNQFPAATAIILDKLPEELTRQLILGVTGGRVLPEKIFQRILQKTGGIPLFVEELTKTVLQMGVLRDANGRFELLEEVDSLRIPTTLQDSLTARIDHLGEAKEVVQLGAMLGREFSFRLLEAICEIGPESLQTQLEHLVAEGFLRTRGEPPLSSYSFEHPLVQDAAYNLLLRETRRKHHRKVARILVEEFPEVAATAPEIVARHFTESEQPEEAIAYWLKAAKRAATKSANLEAIDHLKQGLRLLQDLPDSTDRDKVEIELQVALGSISTVIKGFLAPEVEAAYQRANELCTQGEGGSEQFWVLQGLNFYHMVRGELTTGLALVQQMLELAEDCGQPDLVASAQGLLGNTCFFLGAFKKALAWSTTSSASILATPLSYLEHTGVQLEVVNHFISSLCLWHLGSFDRAFREAEKSLSLSRKNPWAYSRATALVFGGSLVYFLNREAAKVQELAQELRQLSDSKGYPVWSLLGVIFDEWASTMLNEKGPRQGTEISSHIESLENSINTLQALGNQLLLPQFLCILAEALFRQGRSAQAKTRLTEALAIATNTGDRCCEPEIHRLLGDVESRGTDEQVSTDFEAAEKAYLRALGVADMIGSKTLGLRAAVSLGKLWRKLEKTGPAEGLVQERYDSFTEGFGNWDLVEARTFLESH